VGIIVASGDGESVVDATVVIETFPTFSGIDGVHSAKSYKRREAVVRIQQENIMN
jgi:hypothetical protein